MQNFKFLAFFVQILAVVFTPPPHPPTHTHTHTHKPNINKKAQEK